MSTNKLHNNNGGQFILSYELLYLLQWLIEHEAEALKKIIVRAVRQGFKDHPSTQGDSIELHVSDAHIQNSIAEFLGLLDLLLIEARNEQDIKKTLERNLIPALNQIDSTMCATETVETSLARASSKIEDHPDENLKDALLKELIKRWKPDKKCLMN